MDEPASALDPIATLKIEDLMRELGGASTIAGHPQHAAGRTRVGPFTGAADSWEQHEALAATDLEQRDDQADLLQESMLTELYTGPSSVEEAVSLALLARHYERVADHGVEIGRHVAYMVTGHRPDPGGMVVSRLAVSVARLAAGPGRFLSTAGSWAIVTLLAVALAGQVRGIVRANRLAFAGHDPADTYPFGSLAVSSLAYAVTFGSELAVVSMLPTFFGETFGLGVVAATGPRLPERPSVHAMETHA